MPGVEPPFNFGFEGVGTVVAAGDKANSLLVTMFATVMSVPILYITLCQLKI